MNKVLSKLSTNGKLTSKNKIIMIVIALAIAACLAVNDTIKSYDEHHHKNTDICIACGFAQRY